MLDKPAVDQILGLENIKSCEKYNNNNALYTHISDTNHNINFNKVKILNKENRLDCRLLSEMFYMGKSTVLLTRV